MRRIDCAEPDPAQAGSPAEHKITVRVYDRHDNVGVAKTVLAPQAK